MPVILQTTGMSLGTGVGACLSSRISLNVLLFCMVALLELGQVVLWKTSLVTEGYKRALLRKIKCG